MYQWSIFKFAKIELPVYNRSMAHEYEFEIMGKVVVKMNLREGIWVLRKSCVKRVNTM